MYICIQYIYLLSLYFITVVYQDPLGLKRSEVHIKQLYIVQLHPINLSSSFKATQIINSSFNMASIKRPMVTYLLTLFIFVLCLSYFSNLVGASEAINSETSTPTISHPPLHLPRRHFPPPFRPRGVGPHYAPPPLPFKRPH